MGNFFLVFLRFLFLALYLLILGRVLMSWIDPRYEKPVGRFLFEMTEPILGPIRRVLPQTGMLDLAPFIAIMVLSVLSSVVLR